MRCRAITCWDGADVLHMFIDSDVTQCTTFLFTHLVASLLVRSRVLAFPRLRNQDGTAFPEKYISWILSPVLLVKFVLRKLLVVYASAS